MNAKYFTSWLKLSRVSWDCNAITGIFQEEYNITHFHFLNEIFKQHSVVEFQEERKTHDCFSFPIYFAKTDTFWFFHSSLRVTFSYLFCFFNTSRSNICVFSCKKILNAKPKSNYPHDSLNTPPQRDSPTGTISYFSKAYHKGQI